MFRGRPVVSSLWPRFEPFWVAMGVEHVPLFKDARRSPTRISLEFPRRNAKTRWGEPAGLFASSHLAVVVLVEAGGLRLDSRKCCKQGTYGICTPAYLTRYLTGIFLRSDRAHRDGGWSRLESNPCSATIRLASSGPNSSRIQV